MKIGNVVDSELSIPVVLSLLESNRVTNLNGAIKVEKNLTIDMN